MTTACPSEQQIRDLAANSLEDAEAASLRTHIRDCAECRQALKEWEEYVALTPGLRQVLVGTAGRHPDKNSSDEALSTDPPAPMQGCSPASPAEAEPEPGIRIPGYDIIREIHRGGQGIVYEAVQLATRRTVAVKVLLEGPFAGERARWRFEREVKLIAALRHPNIVVIHDSGIAHGRYFFAMDYVRGQPLDTHVRLTWQTYGSPAGPGRMPASQVRDLVRLFKQIVDAVAYAHKRGVIHRDLKPSNILVSQDGVPCVLDLGLAKIIGDELQESHARQVSMPGHLMGTLRYMSPEQTVGDPDSIDIRTDVYSLGVILYELLTGQPPYQTSGDPADALRNIREVDPPRPSARCGSLLKAKLKDKTALTRRWQQEGTASLQVELEALETEQAHFTRRRRDLNSEIDAIVLKAMAKEPDRRYQSAGELAEDLSAWLDGRPVSAKSDSALYVFRKLAVRHGFETTAVLSVLVAVIGFGSIGLRGVLYGQKMQAERDISNVALANVDDARFLAELGVREILHQTSFGWFLDEWHSGRLDRARALRDELPPEAPERTAMSFLLDGHPVDQLRDEMPAYAAPLMHFVIGERHSSSGDSRAALDAFELARHAAVAAGNNWWRQTAEARIEQLRASESPETARAAKGGAP